MTCSIERWFSFWDEVDGVWPFTVLRQSECGTRVPSLNFPDKVKKKYCKSRGKPISLKPRAGILIFGQLSNEFHYNRQRIGWKCVVLLLLLLQHLGAFAPFPGILRAKLPKNPSIWGEHLSYFPPKIFQNKPLTFWIKFLELFVAHPFPERCFRSVGHWAGGVRIALRNCEMMMIWLTSPHSFGSNNFQ